MSSKCGWCVCVCVCAWFVCVSLDTRESMFLSFQEGVATVESCHLHCRLETRGIGMKALHCKAGEERGECSRGA